MKLNAKIPAGELKDKWNNYQQSCRLINPANKRKLDIIVVDLGLPERERPQLWPKADTT
jgi:succinate dehydrogenase / fumarate reductase flavoprotein subunit